MLYWKANRQLSVRTDVEHEYPTVLYVYICTVYIRLMKMGEMYLYGFQPQYCAITVCKELYLIS